MQVTFDSYQLKLIISWPSHYRYNVPPEKEQIFFQLGTETIVTQFFLSVGLLSWLLLSMLFWVPSSCHLEFSFLRSTKQIFMEKVPNSTPSKRSLETWAQIMKTLNWFHSIQHPKDSLESKSMALILKNDFN